MKRTLIILLIPVVLLSGCKSKALKYNNKIVQMENDLSPEISKAEKKIGDYYQNQEWDKLAKEAKKMEGAINDKISAIKDEATPDAEGVDDFKNAAVKYFAFLKKVYTDYRKMGEAETDQDRETELANLKELVAQKDDALKDFVSAQKDFAKANKFKIEKQDNNTDEDTPNKKKKTTADE